MPVIFTQEWIGLSPDLLNIIAFILGAIVLVVVLWLIISAIRRPRFASSRRSRQARLAITDAALIDERRKLVLVRRDSVEHLVLIGGANDLVIEADIRAQPPANNSAAISVRETAPPAQTVVPPAQAVAPPAEAAASRAQTAQKPPSLSPQPAREAPPKPALVPAASVVPRVTAAPAAKPNAQSVEPVVRTTPASTTAPPVSAPANAPTQNAPVVTSAGPKVAISQPQVTRRTDGQKPTMGNNMDALLNRISDDKKAD
ncbi:MAG: hypothetical protein AAF903_04165 [Pseudomonadota bacterium]